MRGRTFHSLDHWVMSTLKPELERARKQVELADGIRIQPGFREDERQLQHPHAIAELVAGVNGLHHAAIKRGLVLLP